jgi:hypothetical protein
LILRGDQLFEVDIVVVVVVIAGLAIALANSLCSPSDGLVERESKILRNPTICTRNRGKCCHFIYLNKDEVVDKAPKQRMTPTKHAQIQTSIIKQVMTNATLLLTWVTPNDCKIRRGSGYPRETPRLNHGLWR